MRMEGKTSSNYPSGKMDPLVTNLTALMSINPSTAMHIEAFYLRLDLELYMYTAKVLFISFYYCKERSKEFDI